MTAIYNTLSSIAHTTTGYRLADMVLDTIEAGFSKLSRMMFGSSWSYLIPAVKEQIAQALSGANVGSLTIIEGDESTTFGNPSDHGPHVVITV
ncbi:hypothetical protein FBU59_006765, partial [Linderina macrospora]